MGQLLDIIRHQAEREAGYARMLQRERDAKRGADDLAELLARRRYLVAYLAAAAAPRSLPPALTPAPPRTSRASAGTIAAKGAVITRTPDGCRIEGRHLTTRRRHEIFKLVRGGASDKAIIDSLPDPGARPPKEKMSCAADVSID